jgi:hypothetical protein
VRTERHLSSDRRTLEFSVLDEEISDLPYPNGIVDADVDYDFENVPPGFIKWQGSLYGTMEVARGYANSLAAEKFFLILFEKLNQLKASADATGGVVIPQKIRFGNKVFGRRTRFAVSFMLVSCLDELVGRSGVWTPISGTDYGTWRASMDAVGLFDKRGRFQLRHQTSDDLIVDLCSSTTARSIGNDAGNLQSVSGGYTASMACFAVPKERSWLTYRNDISAIVEQSATAHRPIQRYEGIDQANTAVQTNETTLAVPMGKPKVQAQRELVLQFEGPSLDLVLMQGDALRLNMPADIPKLQTVGGLAVEELNRNVKPGLVVASFFGCPVYLTRWAILYRVNGQVQTVQPSQNRRFCVTKGQDDGRTS